ncbi:ImmA/IrrE family metallo-endopeptidase [Mobiluncus mulieris]|uniref:ImmA/IrrE family metallo-endopeptidase n=1 Tax=Mobiluncus mulieris TaxID=2052 RepID=UPI0024332870|nr:ImmA/IrrE family metallo-endopeptidase [Mobiluncus mulieris]
MVQQLLETQFNNFRGHRLQALAEMEAITVTELAKELDVSQPGLSRIINGDLALSAELALRAANKFDLPIQFFMVGPRIQEMVSVTWRKRASSSSREDRKYTRLYDEAARLWREASRRSGYRTQNLPNPGQYDNDVEDVAAAVRKLDGLDKNAPIRNMVRLAERLGIGVITQLDPDCMDDSKHSGISRPTKYEDRPLVCCVPKLEGAAQRFTIAHELAHLIFDLDLPIQLKSTDVQEKRAFEFAGALLAPQCAMRKNIDEATPISRFLRLKATYGISIGALVKRAASLGLISRQRERSLHIQISSRGWRNHEPVEVPTETPQLLAQAAKIVWPENTASTASKDTGVKAQQIAFWTGHPHPQPRKNNVIPFHVPPENAGNSVIG